MVRVFVLRRILAHVDARQADENKWSCVSAKNGAVIDFNFAKGLYRVSEFCDCRNQVLVAAHVKPHHGTLAVIQNERGNVVGQFVFMHFGVSQRA